MILAVNDHAVTRSTAGARVDWACLARRGMLHSECDSVEFLRLSPGTVFLAAAGIEEAVLVVRGDAVVLRPPDSQALAVGPRSLVMVGAGQTARLVAGQDPVELLTIRTLPGEVLRTLPPRIPEIP